MKLSLIMVGIIFLLNPVVGVYDVLPDFIGCFFIIAAIRDGAYMIEKMDTAARYFKYGAWLSIVRSVISFLNIESQHTLPLVFAFCFAILELIVYIPAFKALFEGFDYAAMRHGGAGVLSMGKKTGFYYDVNGKRQYGEYQVDTAGRLAAASQRFAVLRAVASVLPELPALQLSESEGLGVVGGFRFSAIKTLIAAAVVVIVLIPAIVLLVKYARLISRVRKTGDFVPALNREIETRFGNLAELRRCTGMKTVSVIAGIALLLYMGFYDYQVNILPRYYSAAILCLAAVLLFASSGRKWWTLLPIVPAIGSIPLSVRTHSLQYDYYHIYREQMLALYESGNEYYYDRNFNEMSDEYLPMATSESAEAVVLGIAIVLFLVLYVMVVLGHAKTFNSVPERLRRHVVRTVKLRGVLMILGGILTSGYFTAYRFILPYFELAPMTGIGVNILAVALLVLFSVRVNELVYGNLHGASVAPGENDPHIGEWASDEE